VLRHLTPIVFAFACACAPTSPQTDAGPAETDAGIDAGVSLFVQMRRDVFEPSCGVTGCHGGRDSDLAPGPRLDESVTPADLIDVDAVEVNDDAGAPWKIVVPNDPDASLLYRVLIEDVDGEQPCDDNRPADDTTQMPQSPGSGCFYPSLDDDEVELVRSWIEAGALP
jgi:hypothetical protein